MKKFCSSDDSHGQELELTDDDDMHMFETTSGSSELNNSRNDEPPPVVEFSDHTVQKQFDDGRCPNCPYLCL